MTLEELSTLITNSTEILTVGIAFLALVFTGIQVYFLYKTYEIGKQYLSQHKNKVLLERNHRFAEKMIELLYEMDALMNELFNDRILQSPEWQNEVKRVDQLTDRFTIIGYTKVRKFYRIHLAVKANKDAVWPRMMVFNRQLDMYIGYFEDERMTVYRRRMILKAKAILDWIVVEFPKLIVDDYKSNEEFIQNFQNKIETVFPDTMYHPVPLVKNYESYRDKLSALVSDILK